MTISIELAPDEEAQLHQRAAQAGRPTAAYVADLVRQSLDTESPEAGERTLAEALAGRTGHFHSGGQRGELSFADSLAEKHQAGHL